MGALLSWFTVRGTSFLAAGAVAVVAGMFLGSAPMMSVGALLLCLPVFSVLTARRARYQLRCERQIVPPRVAPGQSATVTLRLQNVSRIASGLLLAEDSVPYSLGARPRYVLNGIERGGTREISYQLRSDLRGKFTVGPVRIRIADVFGLVELAADFAATSTLTVTPKVVPLLSAPMTGTWSSEGEGRTRMTAAAGDDDVIPRPYRTGDELRRVHWRSTARYGELMVRREEQRWQDRAVLILDTRQDAHMGSGPYSSFEFAVSAAASVGVHLARSGLGGQLLTDGGPLAGSAMFEDVLLDALSVVKPSRNRDFSRALAPLSTMDSGMIVLIAGRLSAQSARAIAAARTDGRQAIAILLTTSTWADSGAGERPGSESRPDKGQAGQRQAGQRQSAAADSETSGAEAVLRAAGWRVVAADAATPLPVTWQRLPRFGTTMTGPAPAQGRSDEHAETGSR